MVEKTSKKTGTGAVKLSCYLTINNSKVIPECAGSFYSSSNEIENEFSKLCRLYNDARTSFEQFNKINNEVKRYEQKGYHKSSSHSSEYISLLLKANTLAEKSKPLAMQAQSRTYKFMSCLSKYHSTSEISFDKGTYSISEIPNGEYTIFFCSKYNNQNYLCTKHIIVNDNIVNVTLTNTDSECAISLPTQGVQ